MASNSPTLPIEHIFCLQSAGYSEQSTTYNVNCIQKILPLLLSHNNYRPVYYYGTEIAPVDNSTLFPNIILTNEYALCIISDGQNAILHHDEKIVAFYHSLYDKQLRKCTDFGREVASLGDQMNLYSSYVYSDGNYIDYWEVMSYQPCLMFFISRDVANYLKGNIPNQDEVVETFFCNWQSALKSGKGLHSHFSEQGLVAFMHSGILKEISAKHMNPLPLKMRLQIVEELLRDAERGNYIPHIIRPEKIQLPLHLEITSYESSKITFNATGANQESFGYLLDESSVTRAVIGFFDVMKKHNWLYSVEESVRIIKKVLKSFQSEQDK